MSNSSSGTDAEGSDPSRRTVLRGVAVGGAGLVAAGLAGCAGSGGDSAGAGSGAASSAGGSPSPPAAAGGTAAIVAAADVPVGGGIVVGEAKLVVTQPTKGTFKAFSSTCTHQSCQVTSVSDDTIMCPCHGSRFSAEDGSPKNGPATAPLKEVAVKLDAGRILRA